MACGESPLWLLVCKGSRERLAVFCGQSGEFSCPLLSVGRGAALVVLLLSHTRWGDDTIAETQLDGRGGAALHSNKDNKRRCGGGAFYGNTNETTRFSFDGRQTRAIDYRVKSTPKSAEEQKADCLQDEPMRTHVWQEKLATDRC